MSEKLSQCPQCQTPVSSEQEEVLFCSKCRFPLMMIAGKYRLEKVLEKGGFGIVYLAHHVGLTLDTQRVVKVLSSDLFEEKESLVRFRREVELTSALSQRNEHIVRIYDDFGEHPELGYFYVMEYLRGYPLKELLSARVALDQRLAFHILRQLCDALDAAHKMGVVHRDLKPGNIFLIAKDKEPLFVKILDFGIARPIADSSHQDLTQGAIGTPHYMSPEQCLNEKVDGRSDLYAIGMLFYRLLTGTPAFVGKESKSGRSMLPILRAHVTEAPEPMRLRRGDLDISEGLDLAVMRALEKEPEDRYPSAGAFWKAVEPFAPSREVVHAFLEEAAISGKLKLPPRDNQDLNNPPKESTVLLSLDDEVESVAQKPVSKPPPPAPKEAFASKAPDKAPDKKSEDAPVSKSGSILDTLNLSSGSDDVDISGLFDDLVLGESKEDDALGGLLDSLSSSSLDAVQAAPAQESKEAPASDAAGDPAPPLSVGSGMVFSPTAKTTEVAHFSGQDPSAPPAAPGATPSDVGVPSSLGQPPAGASLEPHFSAIPTVSAQTFPPSAGGAAPSSSLELLDSKAQDADEEGKSAHTLERDVFTPPPASALPVTPVPPSEGSEAVDGVKASFTLRPLDANAPEDASAEADAASDEAGAASSPLTPPPASALTAPSDKEDNTTPAGSGTGDFGVWQGKDADAAPSGEGRATEQGGGASSASDAVDEKGAKSPASSSKAARKETLAFDLSSAVPEELLAQARAAFDAEEEEPPTPGSTGTGEFASATPGSTGTGEFASAAPSSTGTGEFASATPGSTGTGEFASASASDASVPHQASEDADPHRATVAFSADDVLEPTPIEGEAQPSPKATLAFSFDPSSIDLPAELQEDAASPEAASIESPEAPRLSVAGLVEDEPSQAPVLPTADGLPLMDEGGQPRIDAAPVSPASAEPFAQAAPVGGAQTPKVGRPKGRNNALIWLVVAALGLAVIGGWKVGLFGGGKPSNVVRRTPPRVPTRKAPAKAPPQRPNKRYTFSQVDVRPSPKYPPVTYRANLQRTGVYPGEGLARYRGFSWRFKLKGKVSTTPAVVGGVVYFGSHDSHLYALDEESGEELWRFKAGGRIDSSPTVADGVVFFGSWDRYLYALDAKKGKLRWRFKARGVIASSPAVHKGGVYFGSDDKYFYALDASNGKLQWKYRTGGLISSSAAIYKGNAYFGSYDFYLYALDLNSGKVRWSYRTDSRISASPAIADGRVFCGSNDRHLYALDASNGKILWKYRTGGVIESSPALKDGIVYVGSHDKYLHAVDADSGKRRWRYRTRGIIQSAPVIAGELLFINSLDKYLYALRLDPKIRRRRARRAWRLRIGLTLKHASPAVSKGRVFVAGSKPLSLCALR